MFKLLNLLLSKLPSNGSKTLNGFAILGISFFLKMFPNLLPVHPTDQEIEIIVNNILEAINLISNVFELLGLSSIAVGFFHKVVKSKLGLL